MNLPLYFRERHVKHTGGSMAAILFGQPLIISVPRHDLTVNLLYEKVLQRIGRYVKHPQISASAARNSASQSSRNNSCSSQAPEATMATNHNANLRRCESPRAFEASCSSGITNGTEQSQEERSGTCNGPNRMQEEEEEAMDQQISPGLENSQSESSVGEGEDSRGLANGPVGGDTKLSRKCGSARRRLFSFNMVNSYGTANISPLPCDGNILKLNTHSTVAMDWNWEIKKLCFDDTEAEAFEKHESMLQQQQKKSTVALRECIQLFTTMETLGQHDPWYCPTCKKHQQATKKFDLWTLPHILVVHLKRFSYNRCWRDKLDTVVDFPVRDLNMSEFVCDPRAGPYVYDLIAVSNHYGGMGGGHYTAYCKNKSNGQWHYFDDSSVFPATEDQIVTKAAYVLFYQRRDGDGRTSRPPSAAQGEASETGDDHMDTN